jgi:hypothetical protein
MRRSLSYTSLAVGSLAVVAYSCSTPSKSNSSGTTVGGTGASSGVVATSGTPVSNSGTVGTSGGPSGGTDSTTGSTASASGTSGSANGGTGATGSVSGSGGTGAPSGSYDAGTGSSSVRFVPGPPCAPTTGVQSAGNLTIARPEIGSKKFATPMGGAFRIDHDPTTGTILLITRAGTFFSFNPTTGTLTAAESGYPGTGDHRGMAFGPDGSLYTVAVPTQISVAIWKGSPAPAGGKRTWVKLLTSDAYPPGGSNYDHSFAGIVISADNQWAYFSSGSRTDHEEIEPVGQGTLRNVPLTRRVFRVSTTPVTPTPNMANTDTGVAPYLYADGCRNCFDLAFNPNGDLIVGDNGPDIDFPDEVNWIQQGHHYGFPWFFGNTPTVENMPSFGTTQPTNDFRLHTGLQAVDKKTYYYDPNFPVAPSGVTFDDPIINHGPAQAWQRNANVMDAVNNAADGGVLAGVTGHRSPLGLSFDNAGNLCGDYYKAGFLGSFGPVLEVMNDPGADIALMQMWKVATPTPHYEMNLIQLAKGFTAVIDTVLVGNILYVLEYQGSLYQLIFPQKM